MADLVLVRYDLGDEYEITPRGRAFAESHGLEVLEESAYDRTGEIVKPQRVRKRSGRPAKQKTSPSEEVAKNHETGGGLSVPIEKE